MPRQRPPATPRAHRWRRRILILLAAVAVLFGALLTGIPQHELAEWAASRALGAVVRIEGLKLVPSLTVGKVTLYDGEKEREANAPTVVVDSISLETRWNPWADRPFPRLSIGAVTVSLDQSNPEDPNWSFVESFLQPAEEPADASAGSVTKYLPSRLNVDQIQFTGLSPDGSIALDGVSIDGSIDALDDLSLSISGDSLTGFIESRQVDRQSIDGGTIAVAVKRKGDQLDGAIQLNVENVVAIDGTIKASLKDDAMAVDAEFAHLTLNGPGLAGVLPPTVRFESVDLSNTRVTLAPGALLKNASADIHGVVKQTAIGEPDHEWYEGDAEITGTVRDGVGDIEAKLNNGQRVVAKLQGDAENAKAAVTLVGWNREDLRTALPKDFRSLLEEMPHLSQIGGIAELDVTGETYQLEASLDPLFTGGATGKEAFTLTVKGGGSMAADENRLFIGNAAVRLGKGDTKLDVEALTSTDVTVRADFKNLDIRQWLAPVSQRVPESVSSSLAGTLGGTVVAEWKAPDATITVNATAAGARYGEIVAADTLPLIVKGQFDCTGDFANIRSKSIVISLGENAGLTLSNFAYATGDASLRTSINGKIDFDYVGPEIQLPNVTGAVTVEASLALRGDNLHSDVTVTGDGFGYGALAAPYGTPVIAAGKADYSIEKAGGTLAETTIRWGDGTTITCEPGTFTASPLSLEIPFSADTDLAPLVDLRFIDSADGAGKASGTLRYGESGVAIAATYDISARTFVLKDALAALGGITSAGNVDYGATVNGKGVFASAEAAAAGANLSDARGTFEIVDGVVRANGVQARVYGGAVSADAVVDLFGEGGDGSLDVTIRDLDLDRFTREYEPPVVILTGLADGNALVNWNDAGLQAFDVELESTRGFTLNRETIEQMLLTALTSEVRGLKFLNRRIRKKTIGDEPQRKFDRAAVTLGLVGETSEIQRLEGPILLDSETLDFTIDLGVDVPAIFEALELKQEAQLENIDSIAAEPVQWDAPEL